MNTRNVLQTLRRVPDSIILAVAARDINPQSAETCLCAWVVREALANIAGIDPELQKASGFFAGGGFHSVRSNCAKAFGGGETAWGEIFWGITNSDNLPIIELAFVLRVQEAVEAAA